MTDCAGGPGSSAVHVQTQSGKQECICVEEEMRPDGNRLNEADERLKTVKRGNALQQDFNLFGVPNGRVRKGIVCGYRYETGVQTKS